jgi:hypothetical protein
MNTSTVVRLSVLLMIGALVTACATPKPIRSLADRGAATVSLAEVSLRDYLKATDAQLTARMNLLRNDSQGLEEESARRELEKLFDERAGVPSADASAKSIRDLAEQRRLVREAHVQHVAKIDETMKFDSKTLAQVPTEKLATARKDFSILAQELSAEEWVKLTAGYAQRISEGIKSLHPSDASKPAESGPADGP